MRRLSVLVLKEVQVTVRDVGSLLLRLMTPLALTLAIGAAFSGGGDELEAIPIVVVNHDEGSMGQVIVDVFMSEDMAEIIDATESSDESASRKLVGKDEIATVVIIPSDFTDVMAPMLSLLGDMGLDMSSAEAADGFDYDALAPEQQQRLANVATATQEENAERSILELVASPQFEISSEIVRAVTQQILESITINMEGTSIVFERLVFADGTEEPTISSGEIASMMQRLSGSIETDAVEALELAVHASGKRPFNWLDYSATSMAVMFLMFGVTHGASTLLSERQAGTLPRLLVMPVESVTVLAGKMAGVALTGYLQVLVLYGATQLIGAYWGPPLAVMVSLLALVICATGVAAIIAAFARTTSQAGAFSTMISLVASAASGSYFPRENLPQWMQTISLVTPNAWGIEIFSIFQAGGTLADALPYLGAALLLGLVYYAVASFGFRRQFV